MPHDPDGFTLLMSLLRWLFGGLAIVTVLGEATRLAVRAWLERRRDRRQPPLAFPVDEQHRDTLRKIAAADYAKSVSRKEGKGDPWIDVKH
jgi:hypothetical protein